MLICSASFSCHYSDSCFGIQGQFQKYPHSLKLVYNGQFENGLECRNGWTRPSQRDSVELVVPGERCLIISMHPLSRFGIANIEKCHNQFYRELMGRLLTEYSPFYVVFFNRCNIFKSSFLLKAGQCVSIRYQTST